LASSTYYWTSAELKTNNTPSEGWNWLSTKEDFEYPAVKGTQKVALKAESTNELAKKIVEGKCLVWRLNKTDSKSDMVIRPMKCNNPFFFYCYKKLPALKTPVSIGKTVQF